MHSVLRTILLHTVMPFLLLFLLFLLLIRLDLLHLYFSSYEVPSVSGVIPRTYVSGGTCADFTSIFLSDMYEVLQL